MIINHSKYFTLILLPFVLLLGASCNTRHEQIKNSTQKSDTVISKTVNTKDSAVEEENAEPLQDVFSDIQIVRELPHDTEAYTQGLIYHNGYLLESTGQYRESSLRKIDTKTGKILRKISIPDNYFGEGIALFKNKIFMLTWRSGSGFIFDLMTFKQLGTFTYYGEGWGLTSDGKYLIMSDGTNAIRFLEPKTLQIVRTIYVVDENSIPLNYLNELEYIDGEIWANVYTRNYIVRINPDDGRIISKIDLSFLIEKIDVTPNTDVLNGIAYDKKHDEYYFTGKNWNKIFVIKMK